jgi:RNA polymerase sigma-70 factor (ECF subfamily)
MAHDTARSLQEELPAHGQWVQELARSLVRDEASAEDLAQEAQLAALRHGRAIRGALRPFLARVTRNFALRGWRDAARRAARERSAARKEALPGVDESAARLEIQRRLVDELAALEPAVRHALVRRYLDGWAAARIARETGEPAATVRWRLQRGLAELRARLERRSPGVDWRLALLPLCGPPVPWAGWSEGLRRLAGTNAIQGALTMKAASHVLAAGAVAAVFGLGAWWTVGNSGRASRANEEVGPTVASLEAQGEPTGQPRAAVEPAREEIRLSSAPAQEAAPEAVAPFVPSVRGRCVDERLFPIASARVSQLEGAGRSTSTHSDGSFALEVSSNPLNDCSLMIEADNFATRFLDTNLPAGAPALLGDVVLQPGGSLRGRVFGPDGLPFARARISVTRPGIWNSLEEARVSGPSAEHVPAGVSGADGRFEVDGVETGPMRAWAGADGMRYAVSPPIEVRPRQATEEIELHLEPFRSDDRITGVLLSPAGDPVPGARIDYQMRWGGGLSFSSVPTDAAGRFEIAAEKSHTYDLTAPDPSDQDRWARAELKGVAPGTHDIELVFEEARWIEVRVRDGNGERVESFELYSRNSGGDQLSSRTDGLGRLLLPGEAFLVLVDARGYALAEKGPFRPESAPQVLEFELAPEPGVRGRVLADGEPVSGATVMLHDARSGVLIEHQGYPSLVNPRPKDRTSTDAEGRFVLKLHERGTFVVRAEANGHAAGDVGPFELAPETGRADLELVLGEGGALEGRVLVAAGRDPAGVIVAMNRGDAFPRTVRSDAEGRFRFEGLTAGPWHLSRGTMEVNSQGGGTSFSIGKAPTVIPFNCTIREGETSWQDLDLRDFEPCALDGVLLVNGAPAKDWSVTAWPGATEAMLGAPPSTATAEDGSFALTIDEAGPLRLSLTPPAELGGQGRIDVLTEVHPGGNTWKEDLAMGRLTGRCLSPVPADEFALFYTAAEGVTPKCWLPILPDEDGRFVLPFAPAGKGVVRCLNIADGDWKWTNRIETEIPARGERLLEVP